MKAADLDGNDIIDVAEFRGAANIINSSFSVEDIKATFRFFDRDGCGYLTESEMQLCINAGTSDNKAKNHAHDKSNLKMQELKEYGINIDKFIQMIIEYE
jgi:Ca2+-binding EF-hand superfamily protein